VDWPKTDLQPILEAEGVDGKFIVSGISQGCDHALAVALHYGAENRIEAMGLRAPIISLPYSTELGLPRGTLNFGFSQQSFNSSVKENLMARAYAALIKADDSNPMEGEVPWGIKMIAESMGHGEAINQHLRFQQQNKDALANLGSALQTAEVCSWQGIVHNAATDVQLYTDVDPREIKVPKAVVWFAMYDPDHQGSHGAWLAEHFRCWDKNSPSSARCFVGTGHGGASFIDMPEFFATLLC